MIPAIDPPGWDLSVATGQSLKDQKVIDLNKKIQANAAEQGLVYVDYYTPMVDSQGGLKANLGYDTVHPNAAGYQLMEQVLSNYTDWVHE